MTQGITRLQLLDSDVEGFLNIKGSTKVPLTFSVSDIRDISSRSGMFSKTITLTGDKSNNQILNNYFDVNVVAGTFDVNKRQKVAIVQNGVILRDNCFMRLLKVVKKQSVDTNIDEWVEYEVQVTDELGDFFKEVGNKEVKELDGWSKYKHIYSVDAVVDSFDHTEVDGYKYTLPFISDEEFVMNDLMPGVYAKQIFDRIHSMNGFSYDWATIADEDTQFDKSILPYAGDKKKLTDEYINSIEVIAQKNNQDIGAVLIGSQTNKYSTSVLVADDEIKDNADLYNPTTSEYYNTYTLSPPNKLNYEIAFEWKLEMVNHGTEQVRMGEENIYNPPGTINETNTGARPRVGVKLGSNILEYTDIENPVFANFSGMIGFDAPLNGEPMGSVRQINGVDYLTTRGRVLLNGNETKELCSGSQTSIVPISSINPSDILVGFKDIRAIVSGPIPYFWYETTSGQLAQVEYKFTISNLVINIAPDSQNGLMPGTEIDIKNFLPTKMKQSEFLKTIYQKYNLYVEVDPNEPSKLVYTSRDKFYDEGEIKDWTKKLDKKKEQELYFIPDITTKKMILSYKDDDKDSLLDAYRGETSKTFGQVDVTFDNENIKGEERKEEVFSPTINMQTTFGAVLPVLNADFKMNQRILQDGGKIACDEFSLKESEAKTVSSSFYPHLSMFNRPFNPTFSTEYAQSSFYAYNPGLFTENNLYNMHWRRTLAQINSGKMLKAWFWLTEEDIQGLRMNDKIKVNNALYYINSVVDYDANSLEPTKVELLTVEDDLKLPRIGGGVKGVEELADVVSGDIGPKVPSTPGGFFTGAISTVIKKRYDENVVTSGPTPLTGNLGMGNNIPGGFRGVIIGDNLSPSADGVYVGESTQITEGGIQTNSLEVPGLSVSEDGTVNFTGVVTGLEQDYLPITDTQLTNENPQWYFDNYPGKTTNEFKTITVMGVGSIFTTGTNCSVETINQWSDSSGGYPFQIATNPADGKIAKRYGVSATTWSNWEEIGAGGGGGSMTITPITYTNLKTLKTNNSLDPGVRYYISDRDIWIDALSSDKLAMECKRHFRIVKDDYYTPHTATIGGMIYSYLGIYGQAIQKGLVPSSGDTIGSTSYYAIWGGRMWRRDNSGSDTPGTSDETISGGWSLQATTNNTYYESKIFDIKYNFDDDLIWEQSDDRGNIINRRNSSETSIDITDWGNTSIYNNTATGIYNNFATPTTKALIYENTSYRAIYNNTVGSAIYANTVMSDIHSNSVTGFIHNNDISGSIILNISSEIQDNRCKSIVNNNTSIVGNMNIGRIENNSNRGITGNSNNGDISDNSRDVFIIGNKNNGDITNNSSVIVIPPNPPKTMYLQYNTNNGNINGNISNALIDIQYNTNNGRIGTTTGTINRNGSIQETQVHK